MPVMENIRQGANSPVMKVLFGIIVIVFVFWGVGGQGQVQTIASVNGTRITATPLQERMRRVTRGMALPPEQQAYYEEQVIVELIREELMLQEAARMGLEVSDYEVALKIMQMPEFQDENGKFSKKLQEQALKMGGFREGKFEAQVRESILMSKVQAAVQAGVMVSDEEVRAAFVQQNAQMTARWLLLTPDDLRLHVPVSQDAIDAYLSMNEDKVRSRYEAEKARRWSQPRKFQYSSILLRTDLAEGEGALSPAEVKAKLETVLAEARSGKDFADLARQYSEDVTAGRGGEQGLQREDQMDVALVTQLAQAGEGNVTDIVETPLGFVIARAQTIVPATETSFEEARQTITRELIADEGLAGFTESLVSELLNAWKPGAPPTARIDELGLRVRETEPFSPRAPKFVGAGTSDDLNAALAEMPSPGVLPKAYRSTVGTLLVEVVNVDLPDDTTFKAQETAIYMSMVGQKRRMFLEMWLEDMMSSAKVERLYKPLEEI